mmetsp:Transcript_22230/g.63438  ORF Transcript_22230/g.63438 Transcript_22230/m.63438 type:complete len:80 (+) Transcript_22230:480-719(+)
MQNGVTNTPTHNLMYSRWDTQTDKYATVVHLCSAHGRQRDSHQLPTGDRCVWLKTYVSQIVRSQKIRKIPPLTREKMGT